MEAALNQIKQLAETADAKSRKVLKSALLKLVDSLEGPDDLVLRIGYLHLQLAVIIIGIDLGLFARLVKAGGPLSVQELSQETGADVVLMNRLLRYLAANGAVDEVSRAQFQANRTTKNLTERVTEVGLRHNFHTVCPEFQALPGFLKKTGYKNPEDELHTAFQDAFNTDMHPFAWFASHPDHMENFNDYMALIRGSDSSWLSVYPVTEETKDWTDTERPLYVNVGGGIGHQCAEFKGKYPDIPGRVIVQDLPHIIEHAMSTPGVENLAHNFFEPQPVKGARFYYMRGVLHDHPPHKIQLLLANIKSAMAEDSILLVDEFILPETGVNADTAATDLTMMAACASMERTQEQWRDVFAKAGLQPGRTFSYNPGTYESVMEVRLK
ncbi:hypothetical protein HIM_06188 [Hirsutella minnesotensis 3608]|uniref:Uncharacterized protein n=1 Tax=Hirsutella minnesotensis 3608 TaxID=1043627 RepID=A0A0F7ZU76_9HYPO|nr:hypothetical protein HIM_06188 [Hirsutella minnesotensis 3608]